MKTIKPVLKKLALGQIIALCIAVTGIVNEQITSKTRNNVNAPALTTVSVYLLLFPLCTLPFAYQSIKNNSSSSEFWSIRSNHHRYSTINHRSYLGRDQIISTNRVFLRNYGTDFNFRFCHGNYLFC